MNALLAAQVTICSRVQHLVKFHAHLDIGRMIQIESALHATLHVQLVQVEPTHNAPLAIQDIFYKEQPVRPVILLAQYVQRLSIRSVPRATQIIIFSHHLTPQHALALALSLDIGLTLQPKLVKYAIVLARNAQAQITMSALLVNQGIFC